MILGTSVPTDWWETTSLSMKTVHLSPRRTGTADPRAIGPKSSIATPSFSACSSRKEPVPAAQTLFISKSTTLPSLMEMYLESWPPISKMVSTSGSISTAALAWADISLRTTSAPTKSPVMYLPLPVTPTPRTGTRDIRPPISLRPFLTASRGLPAVRRYILSTTDPSAATAARLVLMEPTSIPR